MSYYVYRSKIIMCELQGASEGSLFHASASRRAGGTRGTAMGAQGRAPGHEMITEDAFGALSCAELSAIPPRPGRVDAPARCQAPLSRLALT